MINCNDGPCLKRMNSSKADKDDATLIEPVKLAA
jgi:hypothetical protein